ncbi:MAG: hypothetical protein ABI614_10255 [Planctomycetota bacterium]
MRRLKGTWMSSHGRRRAHGHFERLENRSLLAVVSIGVNVYEDVGGSPGALITDETVNVGDSFFLEITAREHDPRVSGLQGVAIDLAWDPSVLEEIDALFDPATLITPNLPLLSTGTLDNQAGQIQNLGGSSFSAWGIGSPIGSDGNDRFVKSSLRGFATTDDHFAWLHFRALQEADATPLTLRQGGSGIATMPVSSLSGSQLDLERQTITVIGTSVAHDSDAAAMSAVVNTAEIPSVTDSPNILEAGASGMSLGTSIPEGTEEVSTRPWLEVANSSGVSAGGVQFTTVSDIDGIASDSPLVRPAFPDDGQFIEISSTGDAPLTISEIQVNVPAVTVYGAPTSSDNDSIVIAVGQTERFQLTYAPTTPNASDATVQSFDISNGLVILSDAANAPIVDIGLRGDSTFDADTNYDGHVDFSDLLPFAAHFHQSREVPIIGPVQSSVREVAEGVGQTNEIPAPNVCVVAPGLRASVSSTPQAASQHVLQARRRPTSFIGPLLPHEYATSLILAESPNQLTRLVDANHLDDDLVDLLATDVNSQFGHPTP